VLLFFLGYFAGIESVIVDDRKSKRKQVRVWKDKGKCVLCLYNVSKLRDHTSSITTTRELQTSGSSSAKTDSTLSSLGLTEGAVLVLGLPKNAELVVVEIIVTVTFEAKSSAFRICHGETGLLKSSLFYGQSCYGCSSEKCG